MFQMDQTSGKGCMELKKGSLLPLHEQIAQTLEEEIRSEIYRPAEKIPSFRELGRRFSVSHETAKEAVLLLQKSGMVIVKPSIGAFVTEHALSRPRQTGFIGLIVDMGKEKLPHHQMDILYGSFFENLESRLRDNKVHAITNHLCYNDEDDRAHLEDLLQKVDGIILVNLVTRDMLSHIRESGVPVVTIQSAIEVNETDEVRISLFRTYSAILNTYADRGCKKITFVNGPSPLLHEQKFIQAFDMVGKKRELDEPLELIISEKWHADYHYKAVSEWAEQGGHTDLMICSNDNIAIEAEKALKAAGTHVPEDVQLIGGRNTRFCTVANPPLTSIDFHYDDLIDLALERLQLKIEGHQRRPIIIMALGTLIERGTTALLLEDQD